MIVPIRPSRRLALALALSIFFLTYFSKSGNVRQIRSMMRKEEYTTFESDQPKLPLSPVNAEPYQPQRSSLTSQSSESGDAGDTVERNPLEPDTDFMLKSMSLFPHRVLFSASTRDREFMPVYLGGVQGNNINIIPHPVRADYWILVAQRDQKWSPITPEQILYMQNLGLTPLAEWPSPSEQVVCSAGIQNDAVICAEPAVTLPFVGPQAEGVCPDTIGWVTLVLGMRDSRVFWGPDIPYMTYGAKAKLTCFGQWLQDVRSVLFQFTPHRHMMKEKSPFETAVELPRPSGGMAMEKNYFLFWDSNNVTYVHYTLWPKRAFSKLNDDGTGSEDLAPSTAYHDQICMSKFMPPVDRQSQQAIHQATNSLAITMCERSDPRCLPDDANTYNMHLFHHKTYRNYHAVYEPYVILLRRKAPFAIHAIGQRPFWIHGRHNLTEATKSNLYKNSEVPIPEGQTEMFYMTSMNWKSHAQKNHGYMDDVLFISFGIEDTRPGIIDVVAGDLLDDLAYC